jgi:uncharacterized membrane protein YwzB
MMFFYTDIKYKRIITLTLYVYIGISIILPELVYAIDPGVVTPQLSAAGGSTGLTKLDPRIFVANMIQMSLGILGTIFAGLVVLSGYWLLTAQGREDVITNAKKTMLRAVVGLIVILLAYSITTFIDIGVKQLNDGSRDSAGGRTGGTGVSTCCLICTRPDGRQICNFDTLRSNPDYVIAITPLPVSGHCSSLSVTEIAECAGKGSCNVINQVTSAQCLTPQR